MGIEWSKNFGNTDKMESLNEVYVMLGLRFWF
jgi:hypothetical protein